MNKVEFTIENGYKNGMIFTHICMKLILAALYNQYFQLGFHLGDPSWKETALLSKNLTKV